MSAPISCFPSPEPRFGRASSGCATSGCANLGRASSYRKQDFKLKINLLRASKGKAGQIGLFGIFSLLGMLLPTIAIYGQEGAVELLPRTAQGTIRIATYNVSLNRPESGLLARNLKAENEQAAAVAAVIRAVRPDILLLNEVDYSSSQDNAAIFAEKYLAAEGKDSFGGSAWPMNNVFSGPVNTGEPSGMDLNNNGSTSDPEDAYGYGRFPGQYGMAVLTRFPIQEEDIQTLQCFLWKDLPDAKRPMTENGSYYSDEVWNRLRLSSKSFWDVPIQSPLGTIHLLASHPTPPAFDGPEDRNGCRNHDEIKLIQYYIEGAAFLQNDRGEKTGLNAEDYFVVAGDLNSDPFDGGSQPSAIKDLLNHPRVARFDAPKSRGAMVAAEQQAGANQKQLGPANTDTGDFNDRSVGNLRIDYVLPSSELQVVQSGVFWPAIKDLPESMRESMAKSMKASDHHLVWVDVQVAGVERAWLGQ